MLPTSFCFVLILVVSASGYSRPTGGSGGFTIRATTTLDVAEKSPSTRPTASIPAARVVLLWAEAISTALTETAGNVLRYDELQQLYESGVACSSTAAASLPEGDANFTEQVSSTAKNIGKVEPITVSLRKFVCSTSPVCLGGSHARITRQLLAENGCIANENYDTARLCKSVRRT